MKKIVALLLILFFPLIVFAESTTVVVGSAVAGGDVSECPVGALICQNFEGSGYDNSETWTGTGDPDYTTTVLRGSQSIEVADGENHVSPSFTSSDTIGGFFRFQAPTSSASSELIYIRESTSYRIVIQTQRLDTDGDIQIYSMGKSYTTNATFQVSIDTPTCVWFYFTKGAGTGDGVMKLWADDCANVCSGDVCTRPETADIDASDGQWDSGEGGVDNLQLRDPVSTNTIFDQIILSASEITNVAN